LCITYCYTNNRCGIFISILVDLLAGGVECSDGVGLDPVHPLCDPGVHSRVSSGSTAIAPADHTHKGLAAVLLQHQGAARVSLAGVLAGVRSTHHQVRDGRWSVGVLAVGVAGDGDIDLLQNRGLVAAAAEGSPAGHRGDLLGVLARTSGKAGGADGRGECDGAGQPEDGEVAVGALGVVVGVLNDLGNIHPVELTISNVVFA